MIRLYRIFKGKLNFRILRLRLGFNVVKLDCSILRGSLKINKKKRKRRRLNLLSRKIRNH